MSEPSHSDTGGTLHRWLHENSADTREPGGPKPRLYAAPFADTWDALLAHVESQSRWELLHKDEELGLMTIVCRSLVFRFLDDLTIWVTLDENGLTRVEALSSSRSGRGDMGVNRRRIERLLASVDQALGPSTRLSGAGRTRGGADALGTRTELDARG